MKRSDFIKSLSALPIGLTFGKFIFNTEELPETVDNDTPTEDLEITHNSNNYTINSGEINESINLGFVVDDIIKKKKYINGAKVSKVNKPNFLINNKPYTVNTVKYKFNVPVLDDYKKIRNNISDNIIKELKHQIDQYDGRNWNYQIYLYGTCILTPAIVNPYDFTMVREVLVRQAIINQIRQIKK